MADESLTEDPTVVENLTTPQSIPPAPLHTSPEPTAAEPAAVEPTDRRRISSAAAIAGVVSWVAFFTIAGAVEPPPPETLQTPWIVNQVLVVADIALLVAFVGFALRRSFAWKASALTALSFLGTVTWCATHLGVGAVLFTQLAGVVALLAGSIYALTRR